MRKRVLYVVDDVIFRVDGVIRFEYVTKLDETKVDPDGRHIPRFKSEYRVVPDRKGTGRGSRTELDRSEGETSCSIGRFGSEGRNAADSVSERRERVITKGR